MCAVRVMYGGLPPERFRPDTPAPRGPLALHQLRLVHPLLPGRGDLGGHHPRPAEASSWLNRQ